MVKSVTLLDELDSPNDLSVFIMKTAIIILSYFSNHLTFQTIFKVSPCKYYEKYNIVVGLLHSPPGFP